MRNKLLAVLLVGAMTVASLTGCGEKEVQKGTETSKVESTEGKDKVEETKESKEEVKDYTGQTLRIAWWGGDARNEQTITIIEEFEKMYPGLKVEVEMAGYGDYFTRLNTQAAGGELPDVMQMDAAKYYTFADNGLLLDLNPLIADGSINLSNVSNSVVKLGEVCGGNYGVACGVNGYVTLYNTEILKEAGVTLDTKHTITEFMDAARTVYEKTGARISNIDREIFFRSLGGNTYADGEDAFGFTEEMLLSWFEYMLQGTEEGFWANNAAFKETTNAARFTSKEVWALEVASNEIVSYENATGLDFAMTERSTANDPTVENATYLRPAMLWSVAANTEMSELAAAFIDYFVNTSAVYDVCGFDRGVPISSEMINYLKAKGSAADVKSLEFVEYLGEHSTPINYYTPAKGSEAMTVINELIEAVSYKTYTKEELPKAVHDAYEKATAIISGK